jgi:hypothetical protein
MEIGERKDVREIRPVNEPVPEQLPVSEPIPEPADRPLEPSGRGRFDPRRRSAGP